MASISSATMNLATVTRSSCTNSGQQPSRASVLTSRAASSSSLYQVLGIPMGSTCNEIKAAYRRLARVLHPDVNNGGEQDISTGATDDFMSVHEAYTILRDPKKRAEYDRSLLRQRRTGRSQHWVLSAGNYNRCSGYVGRRWETDQCW